MKTISEKDLNKAIKNHKIWLDTSGKKGSQLILRIYDLSNSDLSNCNLSNCNLSHSDLSHSDLSNSDLSYSILINSNLSNSILSYSNLANINLYNSDLSNSNLSNSDLSSSNLSNCNLSNAILPNFKIIPEEGSFIGYKKVIGETKEGKVDALLKIEIRKDSKRVCSLVGRKCRASKIKVLEVINLTNSLKIKKLISSYNNSFIYNLNKIIEVKDFDDDIIIECTKGIHFFITRKEAEEYLL